MKQYVVMGVSGCGKSSIASALAVKTGGVFLDADHFHPAANTEKMAAGIPLTDEDRWGWLETLNQEMQTRNEAGVSVFLACSALRQKYRDRLAAGLPGLRFIYLRGAKDLIRERLESRADHFMTAALLESQFATLEEPEDAITVDIEPPADVVVTQLLAAMEL